MRKLRQIKTNDIIYCKAKGCYTRLILSDNKTEVLSKPIKYIESILNSADPVFLRCHDSFLINIAQAKSLHLGKHWYVVMSNNEMIDISFRKRKIVYSKLQKLFTISEFKNYAYIHDYYTYIQ
ncbi:MAG: LytTR family transcriptional regulator [Bacteroidia bacterium]|nr:LytTR family transcriptional regulator [Bacteroidia bacterium]